MLSSQAECDELAQRAEALKDENASLRSEVNRIRSEYEQLLAENASLKVMVGSWFDLMHVFGLFTNLHVMLERIVLVWFDTYPKSLSMV